jgi:hypothetical protein
MKIGIKSSWIGLLCFYLCAAQPCLGGKGDKEFERMPILTGEGKILLNLPSWATSVIEKRAKSTSKKFRRDLETAVKNEDGKRAEDIFKRFSDYFDEGIGGAAVIDGLACWLNVVNGRNIPLPKSKTLRYESVIDPCIYTGCVYCAPPSYVTRYCEKLYEMRTE